ncbi:hypothetical protein [Criblamydia sequanensis]|nr:hypothetical protein [Criblamydia sequanensis]
MSMQLFKYYLEYNKTYPYFIDHMNWGTALSKEITKNITFEKGRFFTLLVETADLEKMYDFRHGGILPQNKPLKSHPTFVQCKYVPLPRIIETEVCNYVFDFLSEQSERIVIFEDFELRPYDKNLEKEGLQLSIHNDEVYYIASSGVRKESVDSAVFSTQSAWHSVMVMANKISNLPKNLTQKDFQNICENVSQIATTAYDGEGFVFWEK